MIGRILNKFLNLVNLKIVPRTTDALDIRKDEDFMNVYTFCAPFTMTSIERMYALYNSVHYILNSGIPGDFVECGVWKGGSSMLIAKVLDQLKIKDRKIYLYDTFSGMPLPGNEDVSHQGESANQTFLERTTGADSSDWCLANMNEVKKNMNSTGLPEEQFKLVEGKVEDTIPENIPNGDLALLRLDTDWYASTKHELIHLYPLLSKGAVLLIDDFGHWEGARKATLEYFAETKQSILLNRIDYSCRIGLKVN